MRRRAQPNESLSFGLLADWELKLVRQQEQIARLKRKGGATQEAEAELKRIQDIVYGLRNNADIMRELMSSDRGKRVGSS